MATMRAVLIKDGKGPVENLYIGETAKPIPNHGQAVVKIKAFGLNRMDLSQREGLYPLPPGIPDILGVEFSGVISDLAPDVSDWKVGDEVLGLAGGGAYAEYIAIDHPLLIRKPSHLSWVEAAAILENFVTAFQAVVLCGGLKANEDILVHAGASGVGVASIQLAHFYHAKTITATASTKDKLDWLLSFPNGATHVANYKTQDFAAEVKKATNGKGVDVVVDFVGQSHWHKNIDSMALDGRMTILATLSGSIVPEVNLGAILYKRLRIQGSTLRSRSLDYRSNLISRFGHEVLPSMTGSEGQGPIRIYIHKVYPWTEIQEATRELEANTTTGKIIMEVV